MLLLFQVFFRVYRVLFSLPLVEGRALEPDINQKESIDLSSSVSEKMPSPSVNPSGCHSQSHPNTLTSPHPTSVSQGCNLYSPCFSKL